MVLIYVHKSISLPVHLLETQAPVQSKCDLDQPLQMPFSSYSLRMDLMVAIGDTTCLFSG